MSENKEDVLAKGEGDSQHGSLSVFQVGDYVAHRGKPQTVFKVIEILESVPAMVGDHLLGCVLEQDVRKYHERDLVRVELDPEDHW